MEYFNKLLEKSAYMQLLDEKILIKRRSIYNLKELRNKLIQIAEIEKENTEVLNELI